MSGGKVPSFGRALRGVLGLDADATEAEVLKAAERFVGEARSDMVHAFAGSTFNVLFSAAVHQGKVPESDRDALREMYATNRDGCLLVLSENWSHA